MSETPPPALPATFTAIAGKKTKQKKRKNETRNRRSELAAHNWQTHAVDLRGACPHVPQYPLPHSLTTPRMRAPLLLTGSKGGLNSIYCAVCLPTVLYRWPLVQAVLTSSSHVRSWEWPDCMTFGPPAPVCVCHWRWGHLGALLASLLMYSVPCNLIIFTCKGFTHC